MHTNAHSVQKYLRRKSDSLFLKCHGDTARPILNPIKKIMTGRVVLLQFKGQGPVGTSFTDRHLPARN